MKIEGKPCKYGPVDLFSSAHFPPLPYLIYLFTCDSVTDLCPTGAWIHIDRVSHLLQWVAAKEHSHSLQFLFHTASLHPILLKRFQWQHAHKRHRFSTRGSLSRRLLKSSCGFPLPPGNVWRIDTTLSFLLCHLWVSKARVSSQAVCFSTLETFLKLITACAAGRRKGGYGVGRCY